MKTSNSKASIFTALAGEALRFPPTSELKFFLGNLGDT
jgi:hypothetical protein